MNQYEVFVESGEINREEIVDFLSRIYGPNYHDARIVQGTTIDKEPSTKPENFILARSMGGELIGIVRIVERTILVDGIGLSCGGISSVSVHPQWRNQNVASDLMNKAIEAMISRNMDLSILHGRRAVDGLYLPFGYYGIGRYIDLEIISSPPSRETALHVVPFEEDHLQTCMQLYNTTYQNLSGSFVRDQLVWRFLLARTEVSGGMTRVMTCMSDNNPVGYLVLSGEKLVEIAIPAEYFASVPNLLYTLNIQSISVHPRHPLYIFLRANMNTMQRERFALDGGYMARFLNPGKLLNKLAPVLADRAKAVGVSDDVIRILNHEIHLGNGQVSKTQERDDITFDKIETAIQLVLGVIQPEDILGIHWTSKNPRITHLFPNLHYHTSAWDEV
ncbi:MAG: GNAT family N-acetyltransferase [Chloroflexi bacterium]|jgi:predicted acetyltransferase|nr:GNAT family N-acetyltransferase [Chloroflexota bacterium]